MSFSYHDDINRYRFKWAGHSSITWDQQWRLCPRKHNNWTLNLVIVVIVCFHFFLIPNNLVRQVIAYVSMATLFPRVCIRNLQFYIFSSSKTKFNVEQYFLFFFFFFLDLKFLYLFVRFWASYGDFLTYCTIPVTSKIRDPIRRLKRASCWTSGNKCCQSCNSSRPTAAMMGNLLRKHY